MSPEDGTILPEIAVIIPTRDRPQTIGRAVASVLASAYPSFRLVVVDQSRDCATASVLAPYRRDSRFCYLRSGTKGASTARNIGLEQTAGEIAAFTDDDCVVSLDWLAKLAGRFAACPDVELIYGTVLGGDGPRRPGDYVPEYLPERAVVSDSRATTVVLGFGANMALRRSLIARMGTFDEVMGPGAPLRGGEDYDLALRAVAAGVLVLSDPDPVVIHEGGLRASGAAREHWFRDGFGVGVLAAKALKCRHWLGVLVVLRLSGSKLLAVTRALLTWSRPFGLKQLVYSIAGATAGFVAGVRWPLERRSRRFRRVGRCDEGGGRCG